MNQKKVTKFILHGGNTSNENPYNMNFFNEILNINSTNPKILLNYFSCEEAVWDQKAKEDIINLQKNTSKDFQTKISNTSDFIEQLKWCDLVYFRGGSTRLLLNNLNHFNDWFSLVEGKIIAGSSAGVYLLSTHYFSNDFQELGEGLGIINLKAYCHYQLEDQHIIEKLTNVGNAEQEILVLPNHKWVIFYK